MALSLGLGSWINFKIEAWWGNELNTHIYLSLLSVLGCHVPHVPASCLPHYDGLYPQTLSQNKPFFSPCVAFIRYVVQTMRKITITGEPEVEQAVHSAQMQRERGKVNIP